jgi:hypothetical protein
MPPISSAAISVAECITIGRDQSGRFTPDKSFWNGFRSGLYATSMDFNATFPRRLMPTKLQ